MSSATAVDRQGLITTVKYEAAYAHTVSTLYEEARYAVQHARYQARVAAPQALGDAAARSEAEWVRQIVISRNSTLPTGSTSRPRCWFLPSSSTAPA